jgi:elongation factor 1-beta
MGMVGMSLRIMPASAETDLEKVKSEIAKKIKVHDSKIEPIAFGLKALRILVVVPDGQQNVEEEIKKIKGVGEVEIESTTLL